MGALIVNASESCTSAQARVSELLHDLNARAAGLWRVEENQLTLVAFVPAEDLSAAVAEDFTEATRTVPYQETDLGIVGAWHTGQPAVSVAFKLPPEQGSGLWLRAFNAARSVAVPLRDARGNIAAVLSVALPSGMPLDDENVIDRLRSHGRHVISEW